MNRSTSFQKGRRQILWCAVLSAGYNGLTFDSGESVFIKDASPDPVQPVTLVSVDGQVYEQAAGVSAVKGSPRSFYQAGRLLYVRFMHNNEVYGSTSAQSCMFTFKSIDIGSTVTDGVFYYDGNGQGVRHAVISKYQMKLQGDGGSYDKIKFSTVTVTALKAFYRGRFHGLYLK